ncbi:serine/threonine protein kinase [Mycoplasmopsis cynos]|nr:serine/threonine-protein kinase [Mycoplasmopsis cynos]WAM07181.1 serine/threonine protein kinase [Mycoplasmopsis cynos]
MPVNTANNFIRQIANAIGELHSLGIIHRDIKSQNIMIQENYYIKVLDLGISVSEESHRYTRTNAIICSPHYSAPEYTIKNAKITKFVDIYAIGIVYYEMLIGKYPFESDKENKTILMHRDKEFPNPKNYRDLPQSVCNIIIRATAKNPKERYPDVWELRNDVYTSLRDDRKLEKPISIKTLKAKRSLSEIINSTKFLIIAIIVILLIIGGIILAAWFLGVVDVRI